MASRLRSAFSSARANWRFLQAHPAFRKAPATVLLRLAGWRARSLFGGTATVTLHDWNIRVQIPARWRGPGKSIYVFREDYDAEIAALATLLSNKRMFVDVGANLGMYTLAASRVLGEDGQVIAIEPARETYERLECNIRLNDLSNVSAVHAALADHEGRALLQHHPDDSRYALNRDSDPTKARVFGEEVNLRTLDGVLTDLGAEGADWIKIDVEGAEELVMRGATRTLSRHRPVVQFELNPTAAMALGLDPTGAWKFLQSMGYAFMKVDDPGKVGPVTEPASFGNYLAIASSSDFVGL